MTLESTSTQPSPTELNKIAERHAALLRSGPGVVDFFLRFTEWDADAKQHIPRPEVVIDKAAAEKHLGVIVTAHDNGWDPSAFSPAISHQELAGIRAYLEEI